MEFPWMVYRKGPGLALPHGQSVSCQAVADEQDFKAALGAGWFPSVPEALAEKLSQAIEIKSPVVKKPEPKGKKQ